MSNGMKDKLRRAKARACTINHMEAAQGIRRRTKMKSDIDISTF